MSIHASVRQHRFPRQQRLKKKKLIDILFQEGTQEKLYPILFFYHPNPDHSIKNHQVLFSVPKRLFRKAVDRNEIKRKLREAYRKNKYLIMDNLQSEVSFLLGYVYISRNNLSFNDIEKQVLASFDFIRKFV